VGFFAYFLSTVYCTRDDVFASTMFMLNDTNTVCCTFFILALMIIRLIIIILLMRISYTSEIGNSLKVHKIENFFGSDFEFCVISLLVMLKY
jgi:hypothetical protein